MDQRMNPDNNPLLVLGRPVSNTINTTYSVTQQIRFPFGIYNQNKSVYDAANTWIDVQANISVPPAFSLTYISGHGILV